MNIFSQTTELLHQENLIWRSINHLIRKSLYIGDTPQYVKEDSNNQVATFDIFLLLRLGHYDSIVLYWFKLCAGKGDISILCSADNIECFDPFILHLHLSADGDQLYRYKKQFLWAVHGTVLDLPLDWRSRKENMILFYLCASTQRPSWSLFLKDRLKNWYKFDKIVQRGVSITVELVCIQQFLSCYG